MSHEGKKRKEKTPMLREKLAQSKHKNIHPSP
jgi:hypothetical protein